MPSKLTAPNPAPVIVENAQQSTSNPSASVAPVTAQDDDGWVVQSASSGQGMTATAEELKARADTVKVDDQPGRRDVRPGAKDALDAPAAPAKKDEPPPASDAPARGPDGKFAKKDAPPPAADEPPPAGDPPAAGDEPATGDEPPASKPERLPGESRKDYRARVRHAKIQGTIDDQVARREALKRENDALEARIAERRRAADGEQPPDGERREGDRRTADPNAPKPLPTAEEDPKPTWKQYQADGKSWDDYTEDHDAWQDRDNERFKQSLREEVTGKVARDTSLRQKAQAFTDRVNEARAQHADYDDVVAGLTMENTPFIASLVATSDQGAELLYYLGQHPTLAADLAELTPPAQLANGRVGVHPSQAAILEALRTSPKPAELLSKLLDPASDHFERISGLSGAQAFRELVALEGSAPVPAAPAAPGVTRKTPPKTAAPPLRPPSGAAVAGTESHGDDVEDLPFGPEYVRRANERDRQRGRRF